MPISIDIVRAARTWIGTPFHHQARLKGKGVDCLGLIVGVVSELGLSDKNGVLAASWDEVTYARIPKGQYLVDRLSELFDEVPLEEAAPGDLALFRICGNPQHLAILSDYEGGLGMIHCMQNSQGVVENRVDTAWRLNMCKVFRLWHTSHH